MNVSTLRVIIISIILSVAAALQAAGKDFVVVLDPGHGGKDYGAVGSITNEKTINLAVAKEVNRLLQQHKGIKTVMTRSDDRFIELQERAAIANRNHGDLFMSIHVNSVDYKNKNRANIKGASVYALGLHRSASNFEVAKRENAVMELESDYSTRYQGFDPNSTESYIIFELSQNKHLDQSIHFAEMAQKGLCRTAGRADRGVLQAGFWVLHASAMPAVLVELDFICNPTVEKYLASDAGQKQMAKALADAIIAYAGIKEAPAPAPVSISVNDSDPEQPAATDPDAVTYRIQFIASEREIPQSKLGGLERVEYYRHGGLYKYTAGGDFATEAEAERYAARHVRSRYPQAFIIKWKNGQRIQ